MSRHLRYLLILFACILVGLVAPATAAAQESGEAEEDEVTPDDTEEVDEEDEEEAAAKHFAKGRKLYNQGKHKEAIEELLKAYKYRPAPPILLNIARTYEKLGDKTNALKYYKEFLQKARFEDPNRKMVKSVVRKLERQLKGTTGAVTTAEGTDTPTAKVTGDEAAPLLRRREQLIHTPVDSAKVRHAITIMAELPPRLEADRVVVHFRKGGETRFRERVMELQGEAYVVRIPARFVTSTSLQYYIAAHKGSGKRSIVAEAGSKLTPNIVVIEGGRSPLRPGEAIEISSPYRTWIWVSGAAAVLLIGGGVTGFVLSADRESAMERWAREKSCNDDCKGIPKRSFDERARDWESEGKTFNALGWVGVTVGAAAAVTTGILWYMDRKYVKQERARLDASNGAGGLRFVAAPWVGQTGAGCFGRIEF